MPSNNGRERCKPRGTKESQQPWEARKRKGRSLFWSFQREPGLADTSISEFCPPEL
jgi:hypothetical protein